MTIKNKMLITFRKRALRLGASAAKNSSEIDKSSWQYNMVISMQDMFLDEFEENINLVPYFLKGIKLSKNIDVLQ